MKGAEGQFYWLNPPENSLMLTNMAVDKRYHRQGIATKILETCEEYCIAKRTEERMCLLVRWRDKPAVQLYTCVAYLNRALLRSPFMCVV